MREDRLRLAVFEAARLLKEAASKLSAYERTLAAYSKRDRVVKIAEAMQEKNLSPSWGTTPEELVERLMEMPEEKLDNLETLVDMTAPHDPLGRFFEEEKGGASPPGDSLLARYMSEILED